MTAQLHEWVASNVEHSPKGPLPLLLQLLLSQCHPAKAQHSVHRKVFRAIKPKAVPSDRRARFCVELTSLTSQSPSASWPPPASSPRPPSESSSPPPASAATPRCPPSACSGGPAQAGARAPSSSSPAAPKKAVYRVVEVSHSNRYSRVVLSRFSNGYVYPTSFALLRSSSLS